MQTVSSNGHSIGSLTSTSLNNNGVPLNLEHYKYVRSILPNVPHCIESLHFNDLNTWDCALSVSLRTESDCLKWLAEFQDNTRTDWKVDSNLALSSGLGGSKEQKVQWGMVYRCCPVGVSPKLCTAKLEMKVVAHPPNEKVSAKHKQYPCSVTIAFAHNHDVALSNNNDDDDEHASISAAIQAEPLLNDDSYKMPTSPNLKDDFESFFLPQSSAPVITTPTTDNVTTQTGGMPPSSRLNLSAIQLQPHGAPNPGGQLVILPEQVSQSRFTSEVFDLADVSNKLDEVLVYLKTMLKKPSGTAIAAVKQFSDSFERLKHNDDAIETALCQFGADTQIQPSPVTFNNPPQSAPPTIPQWSMSVPTVEQNGVSTPAPIQDEALSVEAMKALKKLKKKRKKGVPDVLPGQIDPITGKRKKRSRCGTCQGCINRDKTQDCRVCRNCLDQKRYGGPGRLKKACVKRSCVIMATSEGQAPLPQQTQPQTQNASNPSHIPNIVSSIGGPTTIALPLHPVPVSETQPIATIQLPQQPITLQPIDTLASTGMTTSVSEGSPAVLSWPSLSQFTPTFQVQQPVHFTYQPQSSIANFVSSAESISTTSDGHVQFSTSATSLMSCNSTSLHLDTITAEAAKQHGIT